MNLRRPPFPRPGARPSARRRSLAGLAAGTAAAVLLAGCTAEPPTPAPEAPVVAAVVSVPQEQRILDSVAAVLQSAGEDGEAGPAASRLAGPARTMREAEQRIAAVRGDESLTELTLEPQQVVLPSDEGWPRNSFVVTTLLQGGSTPVLAVLDQASARDQYKLWAYVRLLSGVTLPQFAPADLGSAAVPADDTSLLVPPGAVAEQYASVLTAGDRSRYADTFTGDDYLRQVLRESGQDQIAEIHEEDPEAEGSFEVEFEPADHPAKAVRTVDGGAMVLVALRSQETLQAEERWQLRPQAGSSAAALWSGGEGTDVLRTAYYDTVALYVPPAGSGTRVSLLGFHRVPHAVSGD